MNGAGLGRVGEPVPDLGGHDEGLGEGYLQSHKNTSQNETRCGETLGAILPGMGRRWRGLVTRARRTPTLCRHAIEDLEDLTEAVEIQEVTRRREIALMRSEIIGTAQREGGMSPVRESDDELRIDSATESDDLDPLASKRMMGMGNGDESRRRLR